MTKACNSDSLLVNSSSAARSHARVRKTTHTHPTIQILSFPSLHLLALHVPAFNFLLWPAVVRAPARVSGRRIQFGRAFFVVRVLAKGWKGGLMSGRVRS